VSSLKILYQRKQPVEVPLDLMGAFDFGSIIEQARNVTGLD